MKTDSKRAIRSYEQESTWEELYALTQHWKSDLEFYRDDLRFLRGLINKYFIWITQKDNIVKVREIEANLLKVGRNSSDLLEKTSRHLLHLGELVEDSNNESARIIRMQHQHLEDAISNFVKDFRANRKEAFEITEYVVDSEQLSKVFDS